MTSTSAAPAGRLPLRRKRQVDEFAQLLDGGPTTAASQSDPHLAPLVDLATALRSMPLGPAPDFRAALRQRLVAVASVQGVGEVSLPAAVRDPAAAPGLSDLPKRINEWAEGWRVRRRFVTVTAAASAVVILGGVGLAGARSLPGQPFYGVKRGVERVQLAFAGSTEAKGERHLQFAQTRLHEVAALVHSPEAIGVPANAHTHVIAGGATLGGSLNSRVISTLRDMDKETTAGTKDLTTAFARSHDSHPLRVLATFASHQRSTLAAVLPSLPPAAAAQAASSLALIQRVDTRAGALLTAPSCTAACVPPGPATTSGTPSTPAPGDDLGTAPCTCTQPNGSTSGSTDGSTGNQPAPTPSPTSTPKPDGDNQQPSGTQTTSPQPSPTPTTLQDQIGTIVSQLPLPVTPPPLPLPDLPPLPVPVPTIHLPH
jgi:hypothetical protein